MFASTPSLNTTGGKKKSETRHCHRSHSVKYFSFQQAVEQQWVDPVIRLQQRTAANLLQLQSSSSQGVRPTDWIHSNRVYILSIGARFERRGGNHDARWLQDSLDKSPLHTHIHTHDTSSSSASCSLTHSCQQAHNLTESHQSETDITIDRLK